VDVTLLLVGLLKSCIWIGAATVTFRHRMYVSFSASLISTVNSSVFSLYVAGVYTPRWLLNAVTITSIPVVSLIAAALILNAWGVKVADVVARRREARR
jgi:hypothetical protein